MSAALAEPPPVAEGETEVDERFEYDAPRFYDFDEGSPLGEQADGWFDTEAPKGEELDGFWVLSCWRGSWGLHVARALAQK